MNVQITAAMITGLLCLFLKILIAPYYGVEGVVWASVIPMVVVGTLPLIWSAKIVLARLDLNVSTLALHPKNLKS